jgi:hypothetical protein
MRSHSMTETQFLRAAQALRRDLLVGGRRAHGDDAVLCRVELLYRSATSVFARGGRDCCCRSLIDVRSSQAGPVAAERILATAIMPDAKQRPHADQDEHRGEGTRDPGERRFLRGPRPRGAELAEAGRIFAGIRSRGQARRRLRARGAPSTARCTASLHSSSEEPGCGCQGDDGDEAQRYRVRHDVPERHPLKEHAADHHQEVP